MTEIAVAFAAGVAGSIGPCAAPRYLALAGLAGGAETKTRLRTLAAFIAGVVCGSAAVVTSTTLLTRALQWSSPLYASLSALFVAYGVFALFFRREHRCSAVRTRVASFGGAFGVGAACAALPSPCCTPALLALGAVGSASPSVAFGAVIAGAFAMGHLLPLIAVSLAADPMAKAFSARNAQGAVQTVGAGLSIALGAYYGVLA